MPHTLRAPKRPRFESDDIARLTWEAKWADDRIEQLAQELKDVNARYAELRSVVHMMETNITQLTARVQEEEHRAEIAEGRLIELEELVASESEEEKQLEEIMAGENVNMTVAELNELINRKVAEAIANYTQTHTTGPHGPTGGLVNQQGPALTWWNSNVQTLGLGEANALTWNGFKTLMQEEYCPRNEVQK
ncbi:hypothetical protein E3N88_06232 [Mikania micrantha]|uniref:Retrotransposon gag domain-containing protein n=1 Tax=Mikania micrantha TaxID=192012 RepID=A0A5N6PPC4_9ASTR|nr:hypothetical protein E3N88_06232 [Mikania micrantha]